MPTEAEGNYASMGDKELLAAYVDAREKEVRARDIRFRTEYVIKQRVEERDATGIPDDEYLCTVKEQPPSPPYDSELLIPLLEIFNEGDLGECYEGGHRGPAPWIPAKWDTVKLKTMARLYGGDVLDILAKARLPGRLQITVERRE